MLLISTFNAINFAYKNVQRYKNIFTNEVSEIMLKIGIFAFLYIMLYMPVLVSVGYVGD